MDFNLVLVTVVGILMATIRRAAPLLITALGGLFSEVTGVVNIGLEGMMLMGAFAAATTSYYTGSPYLGVLGGMLAGGLMGLLHGILSIKYKGNQIVSGVAINLFASGFTVFMLRTLFNTASSTPSVPQMPRVLGVSLLVVIIYLAAFGVHIFLYKTQTGLRMRAVGEHPLAADTVGISVEKIRYFGVVMSGVLAGLGGSYLSIGTLARFTKEMSAGRGFIALAALVFGKWKPKGVFIASILFGLADAGQTLIQQYNKTIPVEFIKMIPYILTLLALAGVVGKAVAPSASGKPYEGTH